MDLQKMLKNKKMKEKKKKKKKVKMKVDGQQVRQVKKSVISTCST